MFGWMDGWDLRREEGKPGEPGRLCSYGGKEGFSGTTFARGANGRRGRRLLEKTETNQPKMGARDWEDR